MSMDKTLLPNKRIGAVVMNSLKGGVVPRDGLEYIAVGRKQEIEAVLHDVDFVEQGGAAFRFIVGNYGSGKSFFLQTIRSHVMKRGFVVVDADLSPERRLMGTKGQGLATYKELIKNMSTKTRPDGGALPLILEKWISAIQTEVYGEGFTDRDSREFAAAVKQKIASTVGDVQGMVHGFDFAQVIQIYWAAALEGDDDRKNLALRWFRGEFTNKTEARRALGVNVTITDDNWYEYLKLMSAFMVQAGYKGMMVLIDELVNIYKIPHSVTRQYNYEKLLAMYNDAMQGKAGHIGFLVSGTPKSMEDTRKGVFSYEALRSRLESGKFAVEGAPDLMAPVIRLEPLTYEEMFVLVEKLSAIHGVLNGYEPRFTQQDYVDFLTVEYGRIGADSRITPREVIRDFIELLNILLQNPGRSPASVLHGDELQFSIGDVDEEFLHAEFAAFEL